MNDAAKVWMRPPWGQGDPKEVEATPDVIVPMMVAGWTQCEPPKPNREENENVHD